jgi:hypothetical protein
MASAVLAMAAAALAIICRWCRDGRHGIRADLSTLAVCGGLIAVGLWTSPIFDHDQDMRARDAGQMFTALATYLAWPNHLLTPLVFIQWLPFLLLARAYLTRRIADGPLARFALGLGLWVWLEAAAMALLRAGFRETPPPRYADILAYGLLANAAGLALLARSGTGVRRTILVTWIAVTTAGLTGVTAGSLRTELPTRRGHYLAQRANVRAFLEDGRIRHLRDRPPLEIPHPSWKELARLLQAPVVRAYLPPSVRPPGDPLRGPLTRLADLLLRSGPALLTAGLALAAARAAVSARRSPP